ncbi:MULTISPECIES: hypothetical protein [Methylobacterium]|uniref:Uncharacterized protein n=1 Tax=Methylobacterium jeotgali TaxID=381630 RepID=A0ABQ4SZR7_9HYPH|nr:MULTISPECIES: hypothetical protein [Methylobacterium]PIU07116.1 MAG: hypothetical protein COT56_06290 [Methylobacterium sp. CG09_land_8_20_14_0_10_71_15]PIU11150.1 MAG: hypothetical protein COT28_21515 [Methylobacterium sp. CG08_land_8_20_14_0_20_71_15]GBU15944.1 hypothetical protein AwMethylo_01590 [Methylobacterium sp.]GJE08044.1 hypothetical protein AOPFMNJM_3377 [Methylobacterium jeotgali]
MESLAPDLLTARTLVSALVVLAVTVFSLSVFEEGIRHMLRDLRGAGRKRPDALAPELVPVRSERSR